MGESERSCSQERRRVFKYSPEDVPIFEHVGNTKDSYSEVSQPGPLERASL